MFGNARIEAANEFGRYCLPRKARHRPACQAVLHGQVYERETIRFLCEHAKGDIIHAGTFFGDFLPALSGEYEHVWAFEPNTDSFHCAEETIRLNDLRNISLTNAGLGARAGTASLKTRGRWGRYLGGGSSIIDRPGKTPIIAIDDVIPQNRLIGVIHLDVERYEHAALAGARKTIGRASPILVLETVPNIVTELGYEVTGRVNGNYILQPISPNPGANILDAGRV